MPVHASANLGEREPHRRSNQEHVVDRVEFGVPSHAEFEDGSDRGVPDDAAAVGEIHAAHDLEQSALAAAVTAHDAQRLAATHREADAIEHLQLIEPAWLERAKHVLAHRVAPHCWNAERFRHRFDFDHVHRVRDTPPREAPAAGTPPTRR